jgi:hypothetical protein
VTEILKGTDDSEEFPIVGVVTRFCICETFRYTSNGFPLSFGILLRKNSAPSKGRGVCFEDKLFLWIGV